MYPHVGLVWAGEARLTGALALGTSVLLFWLAVGRAQLVLHPRDPIRTATSQAIQRTFAASLGVATAPASWATATLRSAAVAARERRPSPARAA